MNKHISRCFVILASVLLLAACARVHPIVNLPNQYVPAGTSTSKVKKSIMLAGKDKGWHMKQTKPGLIHGWIDVRGHYAAVNITYSRKSYSIMHSSSHRLMAQNGHIHRNYNKWVTLLNRKIQSYLRAK